MTTATPTWTTRIPPLGSLVRGAYIRRWYSARSRRRDRPVGALETHGAWHVMSDRAAPADTWPSTWLLRAFCGAYLQLDTTDDGRGAVRAVVETTYFPEGRVCSRCSSSWQAHRRRIGMEDAR